MYPNLSGVQQFTKTCSLSYAMRYSWHSIYDSDEQAYRVWCISKGIIDFRHLPRQGRHHVTCRLHKWSQKVRIGSKKVKEKGLQVTYWTPGLTFNWSIRHSYDCCLQPAHGCSTMNQTQKTQEIARCPMLVVLAALWYSNKLNAWETRGTRAQAVRSSLEYAKDVMQDIVKPCNQTLTDSAAPKADPCSTLSPTSGRSTNTISPISSCKYCFIGLTFLGSQLLTQYTFAKDETLQDCLCLDSVNLMKVKGTAVSNFPCCKRITHRSVLDFHWSGTLWSRKIELVADSNHTCAKSEIPIVAVSPSIFAHSWLSAYFRPSTAALQCIGHHQPLRKQNCAVYDLDEDASRPKGQTTRTASNGVAG